MNRPGFSPKARWDRPLPAEETNPEEINEKIEVLAWFKNGQIQPKGFVWKDKKYKVERLTYHWQARCGSALISYFSVNTDSGLYQISFNNTSLSWQIDKAL